MDALHERAAKFVEVTCPGMSLTELLGSGTDGSVWRSSHHTAIKAFERIAGYFNERDSYLRLAEFGLTQKIDHFWVPRLLNYNDDLWVIEMEIVTKTPFVLDFAKVRIDRPPDFSQEILEELERHGQEIFKHHWPEVCILLATLESYGIYYLDPQLGNITFADLVG